jgi:hypothetical protein
MAQQRRRTSATHPRKIIECGLRNHWAIAVKQNPYQVEQILKNLGRDKQKEVAGIIGSL